MHPDAEGHDALTKMVDEFGVREVTQIQRVAEGEMGLVYRVSTLSGASFALKESRWGTLTDDAIRLESWLASICSAAGVWSPRAIPRSDDHGRFVATREDRQYRLCEWLTGVNACWAGDAAAIGELLARMHRTGVQHPKGAPIDPWFWQLSPEWDSLQRRVSEGHTDPLAQAVAESAAQVDELLSLAPTEPPDDIIMAHTDISPGNIIRADNGSLGLLDWEQCGSFSASWELANLLWSADEHAATAYAAYRSSGGTARLNSHRDLWSVVAVMLNYIAIQAKLALDEEAAEPDRARALDSALGATRGLPSLSRLQEFVMRAASN